MYFVLVYIIFLIWETKPHVRIKQAEPSWASGRFGVGVLYLHFGANIR
jgi:hypothetical protein